MPKESQFSDGAVDTLVSTAIADGNRPSLHERLWIAVRRPLRFIFPYLTLPLYCRNCWVEMELLEERLSEYEGGWIVYHQRYWECLQCEDRKAEPSIYFRDLEGWDH